MDIKSFFRKTDKVTALSLAFSFAIPAFVILVTFIAKGLAPFGESSLCSMDGFSQYYPMLMNMSEAVKEGEVFYSFNGALGFNLWAQNAYYTNSPLWLILYLLPHRMHLSAIDLIILFKFGLAGLFFSIRLIRNNKNENYRKVLILYPALSAAWALSGYMTAFVNQFMWTDVVVLLPLVVLGIEELVKNRKPYIYITALFLSIWSCFYLSFMVCIFSVMWFFYLVFKDRMQWAERIRRGFLFGVGSLLAGGLSAVVILPVYKALSLTAASELTFDGTLEIKYQLFDFLKRFLPFQQISLEYGEPNLYCSLTVIVLFIAFLFAKKIRLREKLVALFFVTFMLLTMSINLGEYIWHGFHFPNQLPARQSFLAAFLLVALAAEYLRKAELKENLMTVVAAVMIIEVSLNCIYQIGTQTWSSKNASLQKFETVMTDFTALDDEDTFARMEWSDINKNNYPQQYGYKGISYYSSTMTADAYNFFQNIGMDRYAKNVSTHYNQSDILNAVFSVKYILSGEDGEQITKNDNTLPLGFLSSKEVLGLDISDYEKGERAQQALWDSLCGKAGTDFTEGIGILSASVLETTLFDTDYIEGRISCKKDGLFFTSIPFDEGWEIFIDGEKAETKKASGYFLSCEISEGEHEIALRYTVPGIEVGALISFFSLLGFALLIAVKRKKKI